MAEISEKIKAIRAIENLSQEDFSKILGYSKGYVADIETGRTKPSRKFLEAVQLTYGVSIDWLLRESQILELIEANKKTEYPHLIFAYAFTQSGIEQAEGMMRHLLAKKKYFLVDASGVSTFNKLLKKIVHRNESADRLWKRLENLLLNDEIVLILKCMSQSKIARSGDHVRDIFKIIDDAWDNRWDGTEMIREYKYPKSSLIVLDYPSYLEKNMQTFWYYAVPIYATAPKGRRQARK